MPTNCWIISNAESRFFSFVFRFNSIPFVRAVLPLLTINNCNAMVFLAVVVVAVMLINRKENRDALQHWDCDTTTTCSQWGSFCFILFCRIIQTWLLRIYSCGGVRESKQFVRGNGKWRARTSNDIPWLAFCWGAFVGFGWLVGSDWIHEQQQQLVNMWMSWIVRYLGHKLCSAHSLFILHFRGQPFNDQ